MNKENKSLVERSTFAIFINLLLIPFFLNVLFEQISIFLLLLYFDLTLFNFLLFDLSHFNIFLKANIF